jgi:myosin heavy subunit
MWEGQEWKELNGLIMHANSVLDAFGSVYSNPNTNGCKQLAYCKEWQLQYSADGHLVGAHVQPSLLKKRALCRPARDQLGFKILFDLILGASTETLQVRQPTLNHLLANQFKKGLLLTDVKTFAYVSRNGYSVMNEAFHQAELGGVIESMSALGFSEDDQTNIFAVLAIVLHLGNVKWNFDNKSGTRLAAGGNESLISMLSMIDINCLERLTASLL